MATHPIEFEEPEPAALSDARRKLIEAITEAKRGPVHHSCLYTFGPYVDWVRAISEPHMQGFHLATAAEQLAFALHHSGHRKELRSLALFVVNLATKPDEKEEPKAGDKP